MRYEPSTQPASSPTVAQNPKRSLDVYARDTGEVLRDERNVSAENNQ
jgi:hypothetical protein